MKRKIKARMVSKAAACQPSGPLDPIVKCVSSLLDGTGDVALPPPVLGELEMGLLFEAQNLHSCISM